MNNILSALTFFSGKYLISWDIDKGITFYGFFIALGILLGAGFGYLLSKKRAYPQDMVIDMVLWCVPAAVVGARVYFLVFDAIGGESYTFGKLFRIWEGGLAIYGAVLFAILGCWLLSIFYKRRKRTGTDTVNAKIDGLQLKIAGVQAEIDGLGQGDITPETQQRINGLNAKKKRLEREKDILLDGLKTKPTFFQMADLGAPFLILGQALGRIGCYYSMCCYGNPVNNPAWQKFPFAVEVSAGQWHLATFFIESAWCILGFAIMLYLSFRKKKPQDSFVFAFYLMFYGFGRFILEFFRVDSSETLWLIPGKLPASMVVAAIMFIWGAYIFGKYFYGKYKGKKGEGNGQGKVLPETGKSLEEGN